MRLGHRVSTTLTIVAFLLMALLTPSALARPCGPQPDPYDPRPGDLDDCAQEAVDKLPEPIHSVAQDLLQRMADMQRLACQAAEPACGIVSIGP
jgi:hypothetical protein